MQNLEILISNLRNEYLRTTDDIAKAEFADATIMLDAEEHDLLQEQIKHMKKYAESVKSRANYARIKSEKQNKKNRDNLNPVPVPIPPRGYDMEEKLNEF